MKTIPEFIAYTRDVRFTPKADIETLVGKGNRPARNADLLLSDNIKELVATDGFFATTHER